MQSFAHAIAHGSCLGGLCASGVFFVLEQRRRAPSIIAAIAGILLTLSALALTYRYIIAIPGEMPFGIYTTQARILTAQAGSATFVGMAITIAHLLLRPQQASHIRLVVLIASAGFAGVLALR